MAIHGEGFAGSISCHFSSGQRSFAAFSRYQRRGTCLRPYPMLSSQGEGRSVAVCDGPFRTYKCPNDAEILWFVLLRISDAYVAAAKIILRGNSRASRLLPVTLAFNHPRDSFTVRSQAASNDIRQFLRGTHDHDGINAFLWDGVGRLLLSAFTERTRGKLWPTTEVNSPTPARLPRENLSTPCDAASPFTIAAPTRPLLDGCYHARERYGGELLYTGQDNLRTGDKVVAGAQINESDPGDVSPVTVGC